MAKTIIIIEDQDEKSALVSIQVLSFSKSGELNPDSPAAQMVSEVAKALGEHFKNYSAKASFIPAQSTARH